MNYTLCLGLQFMNKTKKIVSLFFIALFMSHFAGTHFFYHMHIIDGEIIVHSHLHIDPCHDPTSKEHTESDIILISQISHVQYFYSFCNYSLCSLETQPRQNKFIDIIHFGVSTYFQNLSLRAPPVV